MGLPRAAPGRDAAAWRRRRGRWRRLRRRRPPPYAARNSCSGGSSRRDGDRQATSAIPNSSTKSSRCIEQDLGQRRPGGPPRRRPVDHLAHRGDPRWSRRTCARCPAQRRCPRRRTAARCRASTLVSALARTFSRRTPSAQLNRRREVAGELRLDHVLTTPDSTWPVVPSMVMMSPARKVRPRARISPALQVDVDFPGARRRKACPMPRATTAAWLGHAAAGRDNAARGVHAARCPPARPSPRAPGSPRPPDLAPWILGLGGGEDDLASGRARRGGQAGGDHLAV